MQSGGNYSSGNLNLTQQQLQQMMLMQQQGAQYGNVLGNYQQYVQAAAVSAAQRPASATPPPAMPQTQPLHQQHVVQQQQQQQQQQQVARVSDNGDDGFDLDDIPSPGGSPAGAGAGPATTASQQQQQPSVSYGQPASQAATLLHQIPGQLSAQQQLLLQQQRQQAQFAGRQQIQQQPAPSQPQQLGVQHPASQSMPAQLQQLHAGRQTQQQHGTVPAVSRPTGLTPAQQLAAADQVALHSRKVGVGHSGATVKPSSFPQQAAPGHELPPAAQAAFAARQAAQQPQSHQPAQRLTPQPGQQQQQQQQQQSQQPVQQQMQQQAAGTTGTKRKREPAPLLPAPDDALNLETVIFRLRQHMPLSSTPAGAAGPVDGPAVSVDDILKKYEAAKAKAAAGTKGSKAGGKDSKRDDESRLLPESQLRRLMELQGLSKSFRLQPELADELMKLTDDFVIDALDFGCSLAARRSNRTLRTSDLALYMQRTYHLHIPGFSKEYTPYKRPVASDLHKSRSVAVRKAQLQPQQQQQGGGGGGQGATGKSGGAGVRFSMD